MAISPISRGSHYRPDLAHDLRGIELVLTALFTNLPTPFLFVDPPPEHGQPNQRKVSSVGESEEEGLCPTSLNPELVFVSFEAHPTYAKRSHTLPTHKHDSHLLCHPRVIYATSFFFPPSFLCISLFFLSLSSCCW